MIRSQELLRERDASREQNEALQTRLEVLEFHEVNYLEKIGQLKKEIRAVEDKLVWPSGLDAGRSNMQ